MRDVTSDWDDVHRGDVLAHLVGSLRDWSGQDPRLISMVLREADVVRCSLFDLAVIGTDAKAVRQAMKPAATLVVDDDGGTTALGTFGEVSQKAPDASRAPRAPHIQAESNTAAICIELARPCGLGETPAARWHRILRRALRD